MKKRMMRFKGRTAKVVILFLLISLVLIPSQISFASTPNLSYLLANCKAGYVLLGHSTSSGIPLPIGYWTHAGIFDKERFDAGYKDCILSASNETSSGFCVGYEYIDKWAKEEDLGIFGVQNYTVEKGIAAVKYSKDFIGKNYAFTPDVGGDDLWNCSKVVWRAWDSQGIKIGEPELMFSNWVISPQRIFESNNVYRLDTSPFCVPFYRTDLTLGNVQYTKGDFNGDGKTDVILTNSTGSYWYFSTGTGNNYIISEPYRRTDLTLGNVQFTPGDFNGDGKDEIILTNSTGSYWYYNTGTGNNYIISEPYRRTDLTLGNVQFTPGDFNGDGKTDLILTNRTGSYWYFSTGAGNTYGIHEPYQRNDLALGNVKFTPGDFNGDGKDEIILTNSSGSYWYFNTGTGNNYIISEPYRRTDLTLGNVQYTKGDFNGDGKTDIILTDRSCSYWYFSTGTGTTYGLYQTYYRTDLTLGNVQFTPGDFNGDRKVEIILTNSSGSYWYYNTGTENTYSIEQPYCRTDLTLGNVQYTPGDFNGDGKSETILTNSTGSYWYYDNPNWYYYN